MADQKDSKQYDPKTVENKWITHWHEGGFSKAIDDAVKVPYAITLPPPNVTGSLHMGHALGGTIQDILIRWRRMEGRNSMWMPGTDHAGIATQMLVERDLKRRENKSRYDLGRDVFLERVWEWKEKFGGRIKEQMTLMGYSLDRERERFTMDEKSSAAVRESFVRLYEDGLIYRAHRLVNWCVECYTAISDLEVNNEDEAGHLWELKYPVVGEDRYIVVATTRPETMLGDTGVAVHSEDERYKDLIGKKLKLPLCDREIVVVADDFVDPEFGSGAVKVTPGHDFNDFECGQRCGLDSLSIIGKDGKIMAPAPAKYVGMSVLAARKTVLADLEKQGFLGEVKKHTVPKGRCDRCKSIIEPLLSKQWFVRTKPLAEPAIEAVTSGKTKFVPEHWTKTYMHWMTNIKDWCISRQLWWGHRIPAWHCQDCSEFVVAREIPTHCSNCDSQKLQQDEDVLDTWFSSGLWPFSTLGWPDPEADIPLKTFYPNDVLVTGADIIFFWVARMMMMGIHFMGDVPFRTVYFTPIVTDDKGDKMSKVKGNVVNPLDVIYGISGKDLLARAKNDGMSEKAIEHIKKSFPKGMNSFGADALRFSLAAMAMPGRNIRLSMERIEGYRNFINKLWNASRFALMNLSDFDPNTFAQVLENGAPEQSSQYSLSLSDRWILSKLQNTTEAVNVALESFRFSDAANELYHFVWDGFCSWYIELAKDSLYLKENASDQRKKRRFVTQGVLATVLEQILCLLHPLTPFVTEEIWSKIPRPDPRPESLMVMLYPKKDPRFVDEEAEREMALVQEVVVAIRNIRSTYNVPPGKKVDVELRVSDEGKRGLLSREIRIAENAAKSNLKIIERGEHIPKAAKMIVGSDIEVVIPLAELVDIESEQKRLEKDIAKTEKEIAGLSKKLGNEQFLARAPKEVVEKQRARLKTEEARKTNLKEALEALG